MGIATTLVAPATSTFWFPAPSRADPRVAEFLRFEREWLSGDWSPGKVALTGLVPLSLEKDPVPPPLASSGRDPGRGHAGALQEAVQLRPSTRARTSSLSPSSR
ncbi:MAG TPA: hypothetical protein VEZ18_22295 [Geodermatophilus sp.]|nr:hypothetical protein [Geodermatophilus sp.]